MPVQTSITYGVRDDLKVAAVENQDFVPIAPLVLPIRRVSRNKGQLGKWGIGNFSQLLTDGDMIRKPGAKAKEVKSRIGEITFECKEDALQESYDDQDRAEYEDQFQMEGTMSARLLTTARLLREYRAQALLYNLTTFSVGNGNYYDPTVAFDNTSAKIRDYIKYALNLLYINGGDPTKAKLQCSYKTFMTMLVAESIVTNLRGVVVASSEMVDANKKMLASQLGVQDVIVGNCSYSTTEDNQTPSLATIWPDGYLQVANFGEGGVAEARLGSTYVNESDIPYEQIDVYRDESVPGDFVRFRGNCGMQLDFSKRGVVVKTAL